MYNIKEKTQKSVYQIMNVLVLSRITYKNV